VDYRNLTTGDREPKTQNQQITDNRNRRQKSKNKELKQATENRNRTTATENRQQVNNQMLQRKPKKLTTDNLYTTSDRRQMTTENRHAKKDKCSSTSKTDKRNPEAETRRRNINNM
jgi:hypothetical protein